MPTISFSGLSSGIDTSGWVDALVSVRQQTITSLQEQQEAQEALLNVVNEIKSYFSSFQSCLSKITDSQFGIPTMDLFMQNQFQHKTGSKLRDASLSQHSEHCPLSFPCVCFRHCRCHHVVHIAHVGTFSLTLSPAFTSHVV